MGGDKCVEVMITLGAMGRTLTFALNEGAPQ